VGVWERDYQKVLCNFALIRRGKYQVMRDRSTAKSCVRGLPGLLDHFLLIMGLLVRAGFWAYSKFVSERSHSNFHGKVTWIRIGYLNFYRYQMGAGASIIPQLYISPWDFFKVKLLAVPFSWLFQTHFWDDYFLYLTSESELLSVSTNSKNLRLKRSHIPSLILCILCTLMKRPLRY